ncbi:hypothetical protein C9374_004406 [Naegleria lovaniensis]|uniref:Alpha-ketoglutarate-dependent dioxygenase AlkB-like domain-containing protein n=1 Tax=Naegleria lovaniensis TaxID=51637 RepID=A0AA88GGF5_NAELO|nr:uncharacterized protein C9374_011208 [Naegleria lovaniensis]XP_044548748.1 uncharacterized protein C9374_004406 [Naegleria lovaniensis]KAG2374129.1 hypothetical protein C9374_011208 [Naegleria lovaniensis]KAG2383069.1 hypothetical protein C9374_004406 [Naegleria lovaniensis]
MSTQQHLEFTRPVVSISLGNDALFQNRNSLDTHDNDIQQVLLHSGDVVIFGGRSRMVFHSVPKIYPNTISNEEIRHSMGEQFGMGRFNITMRNEYKFKEKCNYLWKDE